MLRQAMYPSKREDDPAGSKAITEDGVWLAANKPDQSAFLPLWMRIVRVAVNEVISLFLLAYGQIMHGLA